jgi:hypothetical protein
MTGVLPLARQLLPTQRYKEQQDVSRSPHESD